MSQSMSMRVPISLQENHELKENKDRLEAKMNSTGSLTQTEAMCLDQIVKEQSQRMVDEHDENL